MKIPILDDAGTTRLDNILLNYRLSLQMTGGGARSLVVYISVEHQLKPGT